MNAFYLLLSTLVLAGSGFVFWLFVTRIYSTTAVGLATTLLSVSGLLALLGLAGFDTTFVRFLPRAQRKNEYITTGLIIVTGLTTILAIIAAWLLPLVSTRLSILESPWFFCAFVFFTVVSALNIATNAVFLGFKQARYIFVINAIFSGLKIIFPFAFLLSPGSETEIFMFVGVSQFIGLGLSLWWMKRTFSYQFLFVIDKHALRLVRKFSSSVYVSSILNLLPPTVLPLLITQSLGPKDAAYYYMAFTIAGVLYTIAYASMQSVFAEGSHNEAALGHHVKKAAKLIAMTLIPASFLVVVLSYFLLLLFGHEYARHAGLLLQIFAVSALPVAVYSALGAIFKVQKNLRGVVGMNVIYAVTIVGSSVLLLPVMGVVAVGWAWAVGNVLACGGGLFFLFIAKKEGRVVGKK